MISFYDDLDKKKTIRKAKTVLEEYSKFLKIITQTGYYDITGVKSQSFDLITFSSYVDSDSKLLSAIEKKDRNYAELKSHIGDIQKCINMLDLKYIELLNLRYVHTLSMKEIEERYIQNGKELSERQLKRRMNECYIEFAISYGIYVKKTEKEKMLLLK